MGRREANAQSVLRGEEAGGRGAAPGLQKVCRKRGQKKPVFLCNEPG